MFFGRTSAATLASSVATPLLLFLLLALAFLLHIISRKLLFDDDDDDDDDDVVVVHDDCSPPARSCDRLTTTIFCPRSWGRAAARGSLPGSYVSRRGAVDKLCESEAWSRHR